MTENLEEIQIELRICYCQGRSFESRTIHTLQKMCCGFYIIRSR